MAPHETRPDGDAESAYDEHGELVSAPEVPEEPEAPEAPDVPVGQAEPDSVEPDAPADLPTTSTDPPAAS